ncbi:MAG: cysteine--tRNA ligase [Ignavibacteria bacterium RIFOXYB2_FULL_35_12]|nr:MAG: cysteine--tRNA ligase [Ignavibacteria bacterium GWA2_36_19]OGU60387.1 MAG: cysteine--tRNA ligase [Ignavibacteria bacterium GWF2_35_20]OGU84285.1 MAG: cysteine--tRNA ligase [Ignavibacteria bacterium RIFOXYA12_FULL_35_25]OGU89456.1 MAG: cysteine--tRNA ligase [Ignavibacteria bacterium RIFOXYC12_FULL_35_11]OGU95965.1 MAG: cysteine--tRNA ligase [Ignavibacteria bacterium RIFOXYB12_FULL_35_14]OGV01843.1 MAG: cysteine--tRNA ligase [Ignavibacteria bacterium RIFOXYC2_FULL_35_16]OGV02619.1 MAG: 
MLSIYNTLTRKKEEFIPISPDEVRMYVCGPTVYDYFHIGNARSFIMADVLRKYLEYKGYNVKYIMNLTDIDDRIIKKSIEEKIEAKLVAEKYTKAFFDDIEKLKVKQADVYPKATDHVQEIVDFIKQLEEKSFAYNVDGNVFYDVSKFHDYGKLSGKKLVELEAGARVDVNEEKKNPLDFALWKKAKEGEPFWESPWGKGRPGWHIECSAMSGKHLGETFDIHAGGNDLIFPHHENEIAQSEAATKKKFVNYWIHFGFLNINNEKMSKSLGNFFTARDILKHYSAESIRLLFSQTHYRGPLEFNDELLDSSQKGLEKFKNLVEKVSPHPVPLPKGEGVSPDFDFQSYYKDFESAMDDDLNTPQAVAVLFDFVRDVNKAIAEKENLPSEFYSNVKEFLSKTAQGVLGIVDLEKSEAQGSSVEKELIELLIGLRNGARKEKNFALSDKIRNELNELGIELKDSKEGTTYKKVKK